MLGDPDGGGGSQAEEAEGPSIKHTRSYIQGSRGSPLARPKEEPDCPGAEATGQHPL